MTLTSLSPTHRTLVAASTIAASTMQALDATIANVALPHMQGTFGATQDQIAWVLTSYLVASAIGLTLTNVTVGRFGRTRIYVFSVTAFTVASMMCGIAQSLPQIVMFRVAQGFLGGMLVPLSQAIMISIYPPEKRTAAMSVWGLGVLVGPILGPTLGGYLTETWDWRWVFFINLPFGAIAALGLASFLPETPRQPAQRFDTTGFAFLALGVASLQIMLDRGETLDWFSSREIVLECILAGAAFYLFLVHMFTTPRPFLSRTLFKDTNFVVSTFLGGFVISSMYAASALMPLMLQSLMGYPPRFAGFILASRGIGAIGSLVVINRFGRNSPRLMVAMGLLCMSAATWDMSGFTLNVSSLEIQMNGALFGFGVAAAWTPLSVIAFNTLAPAQVTEASAVGALIRNTIGSMGISLVVSLLTSNSQVTHQVLTEQITPFSRSLQDLVAHQAVSLNAPASLQLLESTIQREAGMQAYVNDFVLMSVILVLLVPFLLLLHKTPVAVAAPSSDEPLPQEM